MIINLMHDAIIPIEWCLADALLFGKSVRMRNALCQRYGMGNNIFRFGSQNILAENTCH